MTRLKLVISFCLLSVAVAQDAAKIDAAKADIKKDVVVDGKIKYVGGKHVIDNAVVKRVITYATYQKLVKDLADQKEVDKLNVVNIKPSENAEVIKK